MAGGDLFWLVAVTVGPAAMLCWMTLYPVRRSAVRLGLMDQPGGHSTHLHVTPLGGGIGIYVGVAGTLLLGWIVIGSVASDTTSIASRASAWLGPPESLVQLSGGVLDRSATAFGLMCGGTILALLGLADDRATVSPWWRLAVEFGVAAYVVLGLQIELTAFIDARWLTRLLSMVWIVGVINSFNMLDNMDGLSGGVAAIIAISMAAVMLSTSNADSGQPQYLVASLLLVTGGSLLGFLWHNRPPAKIFMGDSGSYFVGYLIATAMLMATYVAGGVESENHVSRPHGVLAPLCAMAVPLYDMMTVLWIRVRSGRSVLSGDRSHFSHRLVDLGLSKVQAVATIYLLTATCGLAAILLVNVSVYQSWMVVGIVVCMLLLIIILESTAWQQDTAVDEPAGR